jgi:hypothetical protein
VQHGTPDPGAEGARADAGADRLHEYWGSMPADRFPHVAALAEEIGGGEDEGEVRFAFALELFVTGLAAVTTTTGRP